MSATATTSSTDDYEYRVFGWSGYDTVALAVIEKQAEVFDRHFAQWSISSSVPVSSVMTFSSRQRHDTYDFLKKQIEHSDHETRSFWGKHLVALGNELGIVAAVHRSILTQSYSQQLLSNHVERNRVERKVQLDVIEPKVRVIIATYSTQEEQARQFIEAGICTTSRKASLLAQSFRPSLVTNKVIHQFFALLEQWKTLGTTGYLYNSAYPYYEELVAVEQLAAEIEIPDHIKSYLRQQIVGLYHSLTTAYNRLRYVPLLLAPPDHPDRTAFALRLTAPMQAFLARFLPGQLHCTVEVAAQWFATLVQRGIYGMLEQIDPVAWPNAWIFVEQHRIQPTLASVCQGLPYDIIAFITQFANTIIVASAETQFAFPLAVLLESPPHTPKRRIIGCRFSFAVPFIARIRQRRKQQRPNRSNIKPHVYERTPEVAARERAFVKTLADQMQLQRKDVRTHLRDLCSSGALGLVPHSLWVGLVDPELYEWLRLMRLGHIDKTIVWSVIQTTADAYARLLCQPVSSASTLRTLYNRVAKPRFWHGGKGIQVVRVHQRATRVITQWPRLLAEWLVVPVPLELGLAFRDTAFPSDRSTVLLVLDGETQLPVGAWLTGDKPQAVDVGLALYQAIWHVGCIDYPIRGIGRQIKISPTLLHDVGDDICRAAAFLQTNVTVATKSLLQGKRQALAFIEALRVDGVAAVRSAYESQRPTVHQALVELLLWIRQQSFSRHRAERVRTMIREQRVGMPGTTTQAAGWLLPRIGVGIVDQEGVLFQGRYYHHPQWRPQMDGEVHCRGLPIDLPLEEPPITVSRRWMFVEANMQGTIRLIYLEDA